MNVQNETRVRLAAGGILALVFAAGTALGFAMDRDASGVATTPGTDVPGDLRDGPSRMKKPSNGWIIDRIDLTEEQRSRVDSVIEHFGARMGDLQKSYRPQYRAVVDSTDRALRSVLTEEQLVRYDSMKAAAGLHPPHERDFEPHR